MQSTQINLEIDDALDRLPPEEHVLTAYPGVAALRSQLGNTPLVEVPGPKCGAHVYAKMECYNPFGSVKDRAAYYIFCAAAKGDHRDAESVLLDASAGNMARALASFSRAAGIRAHLVVPSTIPPSLLTHIEGGPISAELVDAGEGLVGMIERCRFLQTQDDTFVSLLQHRNVANVAAHQFGTGLEILDQLGTAELPSVWVSSIGTGGTLAGVTRTLRDANPNLKVVGVTPAEMPYATELPPATTPRIAGSGGFGYGLKQPFIHQLAGTVQHVHVTYSEALTAMVEFYQLTGVHIGSSAAAAWKTAFREAERLPASASVVTLFADAGAPEERARAAACDGEGS